MTKHTNFERYSISNMCSHTLIVKLEFSQLNIYLNYPIMFTTSITRFSQAFASQYITEVHGLQVYYIRFCEKKKKTKYFKNSVNNKVQWNGPTTLISIQKIQSPSLSRTQNNYGNLTSGRHIRSYISSNT